MGSSNKLVLFILLITNILSATNVPPGTACTTPSDTCVDNASCTSGTCKCDVGYGAKGNACVATTALAATCNTESLCIENAECKESKCACKSGYYAKSTACVANVAPEGACTAGTDTCVDNAECKDSKCKCKDGYTAKDGKCESNSSSGSSFLKISIISFLSLLF